MPTQAENERRRRRLRERRGNFVSRSRRAESTALGPRQDITRPLSAGRRSNVGPNSLRRPLTRGTGQGLVQDSSFDNPAGVGGSEFQVPSPSQDAADRTRGDSPTQRRTLRDPGLGAGRESVAPTISRGRLDELQRRARFDSASRFGRGRSLATSRGAVRTEQPTEAEALQSRIAAETAATQPRGTDVARAGLRERRLASDREFELGRAGEERRREALDEESDQFEANLGLLTRQEDRAELTRQDNRALGELREAVNLMTRGTGRQAQQATSAAAQALADFSGINAQQAESAVTTVETFAPGLARELGVEPDALQDLIFSSLAMDMRFGDSEEMAAILTPEGLVEYAQLLAIDQGIVEGSQPGGLERGLRTIGRFTPARPFITPSSEVGLERALTPGQRRERARTLSGAVEEGRGRADIEGRGVSLRRTPTESVQRAQLESLRRRREDEE